MSAEVSVAAAFAEVMVYNEASKKWQPPVGTDGQVSKVEIMQHSHKPSFRIISMRESDGKWLLNCNIHQKLKYHSATATFHQWRDEHRQVYGLNFQTEPDARLFVSIIGQAIDHMAQQAINHQNEYQQPHPADNVYQDPHQHMMHIQSAPSFHHDENQNANFRKSSQQPTSLSAANTLAQQQRRASQSSNTSGGNAAFHNQDHTDSRQYWGGNTSMSSAPTPPAISNIPAAPPAPPPMPMSAPGSSSLPPVSSNAPPPPPPPPPNFGMSANGGKATSLADQLKMRSQQLNKTTNGTISSSTNGGMTTTKQAEVEKPAAPVGAGNLMSELAAQINKRKMIQAKADAVDSKSNTSNGSSDSGCGTATSTNGFSNGGSVGSATAKKWSVSDPKPIESPKPQRKLPSASSLFSQDDGIKTVTTPIVNGNANGSSVSINNELLEKFRAELMVEVRLEINKAKQEIIEAIRSELGKR